MLRWGMVTKRAANVSRDSRDPAVGSSEAFVRIFERLDTAEVPDDFLADRNQGAPQERPDW